MKFHHNVLISFLILLFSCSEESDVDSLSNFNTENIRAGGLTIQFDLNVDNPDVTEHGILVRVVTTDISFSKEVSLGIPEGIKTYNAIIRGLIPNETYKYLYYTKTSAGEFYDELTEQGEFSTLAFNATEYELDEDIGTNGSQIKILGDFSDWVSNGEPEVPNLLKVVFNFEELEFKDLNIQIVEYNSDYLTFEVSNNTFARDSQFEDYQAFVEISFNEENSYIIGTFQLANSFYLEDGALMAKAGETIDVVTANGLPDNEFKIGDFPISGFAFLISNGVHRNTLTLPGDIPAGEYEVTVDSPNGNPLALKPDESATVIIAE